MDDALRIAASGLRTAERAFTSAAADTLRAALPEALPFQATASLSNTPPLDMAGGIVAQMEARVAFEANLAVYRTANHLYRALLKATAP